tara:strand:- start:490 stop:1203 length:714 start_codon:yes stop_codon:yes gene_type:complete
MSSIDDFLKYNYSFITHLVEFIPAFVGLIVLRKYKNTTAKYIIYFLIYVFFIELIGSYPEYLQNNGYFHLIEDTLIEHNYWWFNLTWWIGLSSVMFYINYKITKINRFRKVLMYGYFIYLLQIIFYIIFRFEDVFGSGYFISVASLWIVLLCIIIYFFEVLNSKRVILFYKSLYFYFNSLIFIWILIVMPLDFFEAYFNTDDWNYVYFKWKIYLLSNIFLYLSLAVALLFCKPENES